MPTSSSIRIPMQTQPQTQPLKPIFKLVRNACQLWKNGQYYQSIGELDGALVSYSCCSTLLYSIKEHGGGSLDPFPLPTNTTKEEQELDEKCTECYNNLENMYTKSLGYVSRLQEELKKRKTLAPTNEEEETTNFDEYCVNNLF